MCNLSKAMQLFTNANAVTLDNGALLSSWETFPITGDDDNEVVHFSWEEGGNDYSCILTEGGIRNGRVNASGSFICDDHEGETTVIRFYNVVQLPCTME